MTMISEMIKGDKKEGNVNSKKDNKK